MSRDRATRATTVWAGVGSWLWPGRGRKECGIQMLPISMGCILTCVLTCHMQDDAVPSLLLSFSAEGINDTELVTSRKGHVCVAAAGKGETVSSGNWAELLREKTLLECRVGELDGDVALLVVVVNPMSFKLNLMVSFISLAVPDARQVSGRLTLFSCFIPHFTSPFISLLSGTLKAVKKLRFEGVQVVGEAVTSDTGCCSLAQFKEVMAAFGSYQKESRSMKASA